MCLAGLLIGDRWPLDGGIEARLSRRHSHSADEPKAQLRRSSDRLNKLRSPFRTARRFWVENIVDRAARPVRCYAIRPAACDPFRMPCTGTDVGASRPRKGRNGESANRDKETCSPYFATPYSPLSRHQAGFASPEVGQRVSARPRFPVRPAMKKRRSDEPQRHRVRDGRRRMPAVAAPSCDGRRKHPARTQIVQVGTQTAAR